ncbi:glycosyltransferase [Flavihumibacter solisilvae]|uniref:Glycosyl transferase family 1 domain-containing protein n=1 Tax=Flavihumibacter solisilvae TaxID=1349421 RepID=A0A0C1L4X0_9BACT|nr:glycosyltransferase [Flavihumibacter solisilvae]KIC95157.1 hypothetical protein OI18_07535 [Flavihumibacter solisilvae]
MKILEINLARSWRGGERQTLYTAVALADMGHEVTVATRTDSQLAMHCELKGIPVKDFSGAASLAAWLAANGSKFDILHCQGSKELTWCVITKSFHRRPVVLSRRVNFAPKGGLTKWKYDHASAIVGVSEAIRQTLNRFGVKNVSVIPSAFLPAEPDQARITELREQFAPGGKKIVATAAALTIEKDPATMVRAIAGLRKKRDDFVFIHFGDGPMKEEIRQLVRKEGLETTYLLPGHTHDPETIYPAFDVYVMSSVEEGLGSSVLDAFYNRVPVVSTAAGGLANLLDEGRGLLCEVADAACLANNINAILSSPELFETMTAEAKEYLFLHHSISTCAAQYETLFHSLLATT